MQVPSRPPAILALDDRAVPTYERIESAIHGLDAVVARSSAPVRQAAPAPRTAVVRATYPEARELLAAAGIGFADGGLAVDDAAAGEIAAGIAAPVALKAVSPDLLHKTDAGGVMLGVDPADAAAAAATMRVRVGMPLDGVFVERMAASGGVDLVVGARRDPTFGPVVLIGVGGIFVETLDDVVITLAPARSGARRGAAAHASARGRCWRARAAPGRSTSPRSPGWPARSATCSWGGPIWTRSRSTRFARRPMA